LPKLANGIELHCAPTNEEEAEVGNHSNGEMAKMPEKFILICFFC
jgi:hypothetical protein